MTNDGLNDRVSRRNVLKTGGILVGSSLGARQVTARNRHGGSRSNQETNEVQDRAREPVDITGFHPPQIDGLPYGHAGESLPEGKAGEWEDAHTEAVDLIASESINDLGGQLYAKSVSGRLYLALYIPPEEAIESLSPGDLSQFRIQLDRNGSGELSEGDVRLIGHPITVDADGTELETASGIRAVRWEFEVYQDGEFIELDVEDRGSPASMMASTLQDEAVGAEAHVDTRVLDDLLDDESSEARKIGFNVDFDSKHVPDEIRYAVDTVPSDIYDDYTFVGTYQPPERERLPYDDSSVQRVEVTQSVQDENNSLTLVQDKETLARVFIDHPNSDPITVNVSLVASTRTGGSWTIIGGISKEFVAPPPPLDREDISDSANFELPATWRAHDDLLLTVRVSRPGHIKPRHRRFNPVRLRVSLTEVHDPNIYFIRVNEGSKTSIDKPSGDDMRLVQNSFDRIMPVVSPQYPRRGGLGPIDDDDNLIGELDRIATEIKVEGGWGPPVDQVFGLTQDYGGGLSDPAYAGGDSFACWGELGSTSREFIMAHEVNHNIGNSNWGQHAGGGCGADNLDDKWPGPDNSEIMEVGWEPADSALDLGDMVPTDHPELMGYCNDWNPTKWISPYRWEHLVTRFEGWTSEEPAHPDTQTSTSGQSTMVLTDGGEINVDSTARVISGFLSPDGTGELRPSFEIPGQTDIPEVGADDPEAFLEIQYGEEETIRVNIEASFEPLEQETVEESPFSVAVPDNGEVTAITLRDADEEQLDHYEEADFIELFEADIAPPAEFERDQFHEVDITIGVHAPGPIYRRLLYSPDGDNWRTYGGHKKVPHDNETTEESYPVRFTDVPGGSQAQFMLLISDGVKTERVVSDQFFVPSLPPDVRIDRAQRWIGELEGDEGNGTQGEAEGDAPAEANITNIRNAAGPVETVAGATVSLRAHGQTELGHELPPETLTWEIEDEQGTAVAVAGSAVGERMLHRFTRPGTYTVTAAGSDLTTGLSATDEIKVEVSAPPLPPSEAIRDEPRDR